MGTRNENTRPNDIKEGDNGGTTAGGTPMKGGVRGTGENKGGTKGRRANTGGIEAEGRGKPRGRADAGAGT